MASDRHGVAARPLHRGGGATSSQVGQPARWPGPRRRDRSAQSARLGGALALLFVETARRWAGQAADAQRWRGLAVYGVDGTTLLTPDTQENEQAFGRPRSGRSDGAYPQLRLVALMVLRAHLLADFAVGPFSPSEQTLAHKLWDALPDHSLCIVGKGFINYVVFHRIQTQATQRHWLCRAKAKLKWRVIRALGPNDDLVEIPLNRALRKAHPELP